MSLQHPEWLGLAATLLAAASLALYAARWRSDRRRRLLLGPDAPEASLQRWQDGCLLLALALILAALLGPRFGTRIERVPATGADVVLLFDVSRSMDAGDTPPSRLVRARETADGLLAGLRDGDRAALAAFAGRGVLLTPLTPDHQALRAMLPALDTNLFADQGSDLAGGVEAALTAFRVRSHRPRTVLVLSDGEDPLRREKLGIATARGAGAQVSAIVYGSPAGTTIPHGDGMLRDRRGDPVVSRSNPARLDGLTGGTGGVSFEADRWGRVDAAALLAQVQRGGAAGPEGFVEREVPARQVRPLALVALLLLLAEMAAPISRRAGRSRGPLAVGALALILAGAGHATSPAVERDPRVAELEGQLGPELDPGRLIALGVARAEAGELDEARRAFFAAATRTGDRALAGTAYFDLGVAALTERDLPRARDAFFDALALDPEDAEARFNLEWTLRALAVQPPPGGDPPREEPPPRSPPDEAPRPEPDAEAPEPEALERDTGAPAEPPMSGADQERWLQAAPDDPTRALGAAIREGAAKGRRSAGPAW